MEVADEIKGPAPVVKKHEVKSPISSMFLNVETKDHMLNLLTVAVDYFEGRITDERNEKEREDLRYRAEALTLARKIMEDKVAEYFKKYMNDLANHDDPEALATNPVLTTQMQAQILNAPANITQLSKEVLNRYESDFLKFTDEIDPEHV